MSGMVFLAAVIALLVGCAIVGMADRVLKRHLARRFARRVEAVKRDAAER